MSKYTKEITLGITIAVKTLSKKYPFIVGWDYGKDYEKYEYNTYINLLVDINKISEYYDQPLVRKFNPGDDLTIFSSLFHNLDPFEDKIEWEKMFTVYYNEKKKIIIDLNRYYEIVPEGYVLHHKGSQRHVEINVSSFIVV